MKGRFRNVAAVLAMGFSLSACSLVNQDMFQSGFWESSPLNKNKTAELGMAELAKGNILEAEERFVSALKSNPKDIHALLGLGLLYQNNGQTTRARQMYEAILAIRPDESEQFVVWKSTETRPISEIAGVNLALIESGGVLTGLGRESVPQATMGAVQAAPKPITAAPSGQAMMARPMPSSNVQQMAPQAAVSLPRFAEADANIVSRFNTLIALRDQGLITPDEYNTRRQANIGALLPLTSPPPAAGLDRPVPNAEQISGRLRAIGRGLEMRAITVSQHAAERSMILDALMPAAPVSVANPAPPPQGLMEAADSVRWLEQLQEGHLISSDEYARERTAIEDIMQPAPPPQPQAMAAPVEAVSPAEKGMAPKQLSGPQPGVHLASYRSLKDAERGWSQLRRAHKAELGDLQPDIGRVKLGSKGTFYRLKVGPLADEGSAKTLCQKLKRRRQFCEPTFMSMN